MSIRHFAGLSIIGAGWLVFLGAANAAALGTSAYTDELAAQKGTFEMVGVETGMPWPGAEAALKAYDPKIRIRPIGVGAYQVLPDMKIIAMYHAADNLPDNGSLIDYKTVHPESFEILTTTAPSKPYVWGIVRQLRYDDPGKRPLMAGFAQALVKKYGQPAASGSSPGSISMTWYRDKDGRAFTPPVKNRGCSAARELQFKNTANGYMSDIQLGWAAQYFIGQRPSALTRALASPTCAYTAVLNVALSSDDHGRLTGATMTAQNYRLRWAGFESTRRALIDAQKANDSKARQSAGSVAAPKL